MNEQGEIDIAQALREGAQRANGEVAALLTDARMELCVAQLQATALAQQLDAARKELAEAKAELVLLRSQPAAEDGTGG